VLGLPGLRYIETADEEEQLMLRAVGMRAFEFADQMQQNLATHIANAFVKARLG
jgi:hypothetical protein